MSLFINGEEPAMKPQTEQGFKKLLNLRLFGTLLGLWALALVATLGTPAHSEAQQADPLHPVTKGADPPPEGFLIKTATNIRCIGNTNENESYTWQYGDGQIDLSGPSMVWGGAAEIRYEQNLTALHGDLSFIKDFEATTHEQPNLKVAKIFGYTASGTSPSTMLTHVEKVGMSNVNYGGILLLQGENQTGFLTLCPWATTSATTSGGDQILNAYNLGVAAGSSMKVRRVFATTETQVNTLYLPGLSYKITAEGRGDIAAGFVADVFEGTSPVLGPQPQAPPLQSRTQYEEHTTASRLWTFRKNMNFTSTLQTSGAAGAVNPFEQVP
jgi:hypothetical protein